MDKQVETKQFLLVVILVLVPLVASWMYKEIVHPRPHWIEYYDPEMAYYFSGFEISQGGSPSHIDHPGTPLQWLMAFAIRMTGDAPEEISATLRLVKQILLGLTLVAAMILKLVLFRGLPVLLSAAGILFFYVSGQALRYLNIIAPESLYFFCTALFAAAFWVLATGSQRKWKFLLTGLALGICIAVKFLFLVWVPGLLMSVWLLTGKSSAISRLFAMIRVTTGIVIGFTAATFTVAPYYADMLAWLSNLAIRSGPYGTGAAGWPDPTTLVIHWTQAILSAKGWYLLLLLTICGCLAGIIKQRRSKDDPLKGLTIVVAFVVIGLICSHLLLVRSFKVHYLLPNAMLGVLAFAVAARLWLAQLRTWRAILPVLLIGSLFAKSYSWDVTLHQRLIENGTALRNNIQEIIDVHEPAESPVVIYSFRFPTASFANRIYAPAAYQDRLDGVYPREGHYLPWSRELRLPTGANEWNLLVIRKVDLGDFPDKVSKIVGEVEDYVVVQRAQN